MKRVVLSIIWRLILLVLSLHCGLLQLAIEHRSPKGGSHELFLSFDENVRATTLHVPPGVSQTSRPDVLRLFWGCHGQRRGVLSTQEFRDAMMRVGVSLTDDQVGVPAQATS